MKSLNITFGVSKSRVSNMAKFLDRHVYLLIIMILTSLSVFHFLFYYANGLGLSYNDARSHLDIGRRVVEGLKPGFAQLGSVWLPLPHLLMVPTIWNDFMWHSGLSGAIQSMVAYVVTGLLIYAFLKRIGAGIFGRLVGVFVFMTNINVLYMQSTAMTELLLLATMTAAVYELVIWSKDEKILNLIKSSFWIMLSTLIRYDGWFLLVYGAAIVAYIVFRKKGYKVTEGTFLFFGTLSGFGIFLWLLWNLLIFKDPLYFAFGQYSARAQQTQIESAGLLATKGNIFLSLKIYLYALAYNTGMFVMVVGFLGSLVIWFDKTIKMPVKIAVSALMAPLIFNIIALYLGHSVLFVQGLSGNTWFNVRYGLMMMPSIAIYAGYLVHKSKKLGIVIAGLLLMTTIFSYDSFDAVTIDDARVGSSQKNVSEVSGWLSENAKDKEGFVLISAASHDAIIFSSGLPMKKFIHEGTGAYWLSATSSPDRWARWIVMRSNDDNDGTFRLVKNNSGLTRYTKVKSFPFADIYELKPEYVKQLNTKEIYKNQK